MSWEATAYVKKLQCCADGAPLSVGQKLLMFVLSDYHNTHLRVAWPSLSLLASEAMMSVDSARRHLQYLEEHCEVKQIKPVNQGRGQKTSYVFLALDDPEEQRRRIENQVKGLQDTTLFSEGERVAEGLHLEPKRVAEGLQDARRYKEELRTKDLELELSTPDGAMNADRSTPEGKENLRRWLNLKAQLREKFGPDDWDGWLRPTLLLKVMSGQVALVAIPPNERIYVQARARWPDVLEAALGVGFRDVRLTVYPDEYTRAKVERMFPGETKRWYGQKKTGWRMEGTT